MYFSETYCAVLFKWNVSRLHYRLIPSADPRFVWQVVPGGMGLRLCGRFNVIRELFRPVRGQAGKGSPVITGEPSLKRGRAHDCHASIGGQIVQ